MKDLEWALDKERMGPEKKNKIDDADALRRTASHEAGHTIVNYFTQHVSASTMKLLIKDGKTGHLARKSTRNDLDLFLLYSHCYDG